MIDNPFPRLFAPPPTARIYEPPLDDGEDDETPEIPCIDSHAFDAVTGYAVCLWCLVLGGVIAAALWAIADLCVA